MENFKTLEDSTGEDILHMDLGNEFLDFEWKQNSTTTTKRQNMNTSTYKLHSKENDEQRGKDRKHSQSFYLVNY